MCCYLKVTTLILTFVVESISYRNEENSMLLSSYDDYFNFGLFENFEACKDVFVSELSLFSGLKKLREDIEKRRELLKYLALNASCDFVENETLRLASLASNAINLKLDNNITESTFPTKEDFQGAQKGLIYLHDTYHFKLKSLTKGEIRTEDNKILIRSVHSLRLQDLYLLTRQAFAFKWYDVAIDLLRASYQILDSKNQNVDDKMMEHMSKMKKDLVLLNNQILNRHNRSIFADHKIHPYLVTENLSRKKSQPDFVTSDQVVIRDETSRQGKDAHFRSVCRKSDNNDKEKDPQKCHFLHHSDPYLKLGPFKIEVVSSTPYIIVFHDFLTEKEMSFLVDYSRPRLSRSRIKDPYNLGIEKGLNKAKKKTRIIHKSVQCWLKEIEYDKYYDNLHEMEEDFGYKIHFPDLLRITRRMEMATGLNATAKYASTDFQTTNYGLGGLCETHYDPHGYIEGVELPPHPGFLRLKKQGDMLATMMGWLEEVDAGGATAFSAQETLVWPKKGSVAFWFNLDRKGHRDTRLLHGGCPVLKGSKWIMNKWIYYFDQFRNVPCGVRDDEYISGFDKVY